MDYFILTLTAKVLKKTTTFFRRFIAAVLGAACYCFGLVLPLGHSKVILEAYFIAVSIGMVRAAFPIKGFRMLIKTVLFFYGMNFLIGGAINGIYNYTNIGYYIRRIVNGKTEETMTIGALFGLTMGSYILLRYIWKYIKEKHRREVLYCQVKLIHKENILEEMALVDTGNSLKEPISKKPITLIDKSLVGKLLGEDVENTIEIFYRTGELSNFNFRIVPYHSVGKAHGMLVAIQIDSLFIESEGEKIKIIKPYVAVCPESLSLKGGYHVLLHPELVMV